MTKPNLIALIETDKNFKKMERKHLQELAKDKDIKANIKDEAIIKELLKNLKNF